MMRAALYTQLTRSRRAGDGARQRARTDRLATLLARHATDRRIAALIAQCRSLPAPPLPPQVEARLMAICCGWRRSSEGATMHMTHIQHAYGFGATLDADVPTSSA